MLDLTARPTMQRSHGRARAGFAMAGGVVRLAELQQSGSGKVMLPRVAGAVPEAVFLNTSGGLTGGDRLDFVVEVGAGCRVSATTQTAERAYASTGGMAEVRVRATVGAIRRGRATSTSGIVGGLVAVTGASWLRADAGSAWSGWSARRPERQGGAS